MPPIGQSKPAAGGEEAWSQAAPGRQLFEVQSSVEMVEVDPEYKP